MAKNIKLLVYRFVGVEMEAKDAAKPSDIRLVVTASSYTVNGQARKSARVNFTLAQVNRTGFDIQTDPEKRTATITLPSERSGRPRKSGTDLAAVAAAVLGR